MPLFAYSISFILVTIFPLLAGSYATQLHFALILTFVVAHTYYCQHYKLSAGHALAALIAYYISAFYLKILITPISGYDDNTLQTSTALLKNILILTIFTLTIARGEKKLPPTATIILIAALILSTAIPVEHKTVKLQYLANSYIPIAIIFLLLTLNTEKPNQITRSQSFSISSAFLVSIPIGYIISFTVIPEAAYSSWYQTRGYSLVNGLPSTWSTEFNGVALTRFPGTAEDPIIFGYIAAFLALTALSLRMKVTFALCMLATFISMSKGAIILLAFSLFTYVAAYKIKQKWLIYGLSTIGIVSFYYIALGSTSSSANIHLIGLISPIESALSDHNLSSIVGHGVGSSGNNLKGFLAGDIETEEWLSGGAESGLGLITYQTGLFGLFAILSCITLAFKKFKSPLSKSIWVTYWINAGLQENLVNLNYLTLLACTIIIIENSSPTRTGNTHEPATPKNP